LTTLLAQLVSSGNSFRDGLQLSVVIATHNRAEQLDRALDSLQRQSLSTDSFEVIVVNNGSSDPTDAVVRSYVERRPHWHLVREAKPGAAAARNTGIRLSRAPLVLFLDDDIVADRELVAQHVESHRVRPDVAVLGAVRFPWKGDETPLFACLHRHPELFQSFAFLDAENVSFQYFYTCNLSMARSFFTQGPGFDERFTTSGFEDTELGYRFVKTGHRIVFNEKASALHDVRTTYPQFSQKRYASGRWARYFIGQYPEVRSTFLGSSSWKSRISNLIGFSAGPLSPLFDLRIRPMKRVLQSVLGVLCWHRLQYLFRKGYSTDSPDLRPPCFEEQYSVK
jgi:glycosyltransferase involved in cell wall biosynthesis